MSNPGHHHFENPPKGLDGIGVALSALCLVHCLAMPVVTSLLPLTAWFENEHGFHLWLAAILLPLGFVAFFRGYKRHGKKSILVAGLAGLSFLVAGILSHGTSHIDHHENTARISLITYTILGSMILVVTHWKNWQFSRCLVCADAKPETPPPTPGDQKVSASVCDPGHRH